MIGLWRDGLPGKFVQRPERNLHILPQLRDGVDSGDAVREVATNPRGSAHDVATADIW